MTKSFKCELCDRDVPEITEHHLVPKERGGKDFHTAKLCKVCHKQIHALYTNRELAARLFSISRLKDDEKIKRYLNFIRKQPADANITIKKSKAVRRKG
ncbi:HNH endonuclease [Clostridium paraputrificum]|uniref:HNH endonuclease n=1 Tax=Clostridium TaxID=1485 RepID=UPI003D341E6A